MRALPAITLLTAGCALLTPLDDLRPGDASVDAPSDVSQYDGPSPCGVQHTFCADFDDGRPLTQVFDALHTTIGSIDLDTSEVRSAPNALRVIAPGNDGGSNLSPAWAEKNVPAGTNGFSCSFDIVFDQQGTWNDTMLELSINAVGYSPYTIDLDKSQIAYAVTPINQAVITDQAAFNYTFFNGTWAHVTLNVDYALDTISVAFDGSSTFGITLKTQAHISAASAVDIHVGPSFRDPSVSSIAHYDNIVCDAR